MGGEPLVVRPGLVLPAAELHVRFARSGGPGGQNVNKVETKVDLRFHPATSSVLDPGQRARVLERLAGRLTEAGELVVVAAEHRDRARNLEAARARLANLLAGALRAEKRRKATRPTRSSQRRRVEEKRRRSETKRGRRQEE